MYFGQATGYQNPSGLIVEYDRRIRYLDYMESGQRSRGAGFVKMERRNNRCNISLQVSGLYRKDHFTRPLLMLADGEERELCKLQLADGGIKIFLEGLDCKNMDGQGLEYERLAGLRIPISEGKEIQCVWEVKSVSRMQNANAQDAVPRNENMHNENAQQAALQNGNVQTDAPQNEIEQNQNSQNDNVLHNKSNLNVPIQEVATWDLRPRNENVRNKSMQDAVLRNMTVPEAAAQEKIMEEREIQTLSTQIQEAQTPPTRIQETQAQEMQIQRAQTQEVHVPEAQEQEPHVQEMTAQETPIPEIKIPNIRTPETRRQTASKRQANLAAFKEDKWEQLWSVYPHIHPFSDEREYLSFGLSDFVVLPARYYKLVNNSFLLHGFYNFHHLILTRVNGRNGARYFIGVPGNLYQTERETAIMFGFENFECDREPAGRGDFGYYLIPVEL